MNGDSPNVALLKGAYESLDRVGVRAFEDVLAPQVEFLEGPRLVRHRRLAREDVWARMEERGWSRQRVEPHEYLEFGDCVVVVTGEWHPDVAEEVRPAREWAHYWHMGASGAERLEVYGARDTALSSAIGYVALLDRLHERLRPRTYVEIGVRRGRSLGRARAGTKCIGIDPDPAISDPALEEVSSIFRLTSDAFFRDHDLRSELGGLPVDLAFIDGMHLFEFALRDFINLERYCTPQSVILVHDCYPTERDFAERERKTLRWCGDVWKLVPCLREQRPDLKLAVVDVGPEGMAIITGLDPDSSVLSGSHDEIEARYMALDYDWVEEAKPERLARVDHDWAVIEPMLPPAFEEARL